MKWKYAAPNHRRSIAGETRSVPMHPELVALISDHIKEFGIGPDGRIFRLPRGGIVTDHAYLAVFHQARATAFTDAESASVIARRPYDLRHVPAVFLF